MILYYELELLLGKLELARLVGVRDVGECQSFWTRGRGAGVVKFPFAIIRGGLGRMKYFVDSCGDVRFVETSEHFLSVLISIEEEERRYAEFGG